MDFRFDHVGFLTPDVDYSFGVYRALGCELTERTYRRGSHDVAYVGAGTVGWTDGSATRSSSPATHVTSPAAADDPAVVLARRGGTALRMNRAGSLP